MFDKIITYSFYLLFFLTPLFWNSSNYELFEFNKMLLTYGFTVVIVGVWILKMLQEKSFILKRTPLDIPLLLFLGANILSTYFSIDKHTSIWGYYSRQNGGLLSIISYLLLYWAYVSHMDFQKVINTLKFALASGLLISVWGIMEHFGVSPSCIFLRGDFNATCWIQDVQARVFATLGQPNWMAGYLAILIFPALYFFLVAKSKFESIIYSLLTVTYYLAFTFTYSRGPTLGLIAGMVVFWICYLFCHPEAKGRRISELFSDTSHIRERFFPRIKSGVRMTGVGGILLSFLIINLLFGSALTSFRLVSKFAPPPRPSIGLPTTSVTQLENGGTESGQIRLVVWQGAMDIFKHYPIFGSGLETFAYSYYQFRPTSHNLNSEWDFLYNKAHNEYLNYLATTGLVGIGTYLLVIGTFLLWSFKKPLNSKLPISNFKSSLNVKNSKNFDFDIHLSVDILILSLLAGYISYLVYNFFLFSVVILALFFYLFPALVFTATNSTKLLTLNFKLLTFIYRRPFYTNTAKIIVSLVICYMLYVISSLWYADTLFAEGQRYSDAGNIGRAYNKISDAVTINPGEPFYQSELAYTAAAAAAALEKDDPTSSADLKDLAALQMDKVLKENPKNVSYFRTAIRTYFELASFDKTYTDKTLAVLDRAINLAPTDPKLYYNKALVLEYAGRNDGAIKVLEKALLLKPNYLEVKAKLEEATKSGSAR